MEPWCYEIDLSYEVTPTMKVVYDNQIKYLVKIDHKLLVYSEVAFEETGLITYSLTPNAYMPETYQVPLEEDDCPNLEILVSLYECMLRCGLTAITVSKKSDEYKQIKSKADAIVKQYLGNVEENLSMELKEDTVDVLKGLSIKSEDQIRAEAYEPFNFGGLDDLNDIWTEKPSWEQ